MADEFTIDLQQQYKNAFGIYRPIFQPVEPKEGQEQGVGFTKGEEPTSQEIQFEALPELKFDNSPVKSSLGTLVLSPITFKGGSYKERLDNGQIINSTYEELALSHTATVEVSLSKIIVKTPRYGGSGSFKELISRDDPRVTIRGFLLGEDLKRPEAQIRQLYALEQVPHAIRVVCDYLGWLNIHHLVVENVNFPALQGKPSMQPFELTCTGDVPVQLI